MPTPFQQWVRDRRPTLSDVIVENGALIFRLGDYLEDYRIVITPDGGSIEVNVLPMNTDAEPVGSLRLDGKTSRLDALRHEVFSQIRQIRSALQNLQDHLNTVESAARTLLFASGIKSYDGKINNEDIGLLDLARTLSFWHGVYDWRAVLHYRWTPRSEPHNIEFDYLLFGTTDRGWKRVVGVEFKETDFPKAVAQAIKRHRYTHYQYVVVKLSMTDVVNMYFDALAEAKESGIGVMTVGCDRVPHVLLKAKYNRNAKDSLYDSVSSWFENVNKAEEVDDAQQKILDYLQLNTKEDSG